ncbi:MAG TPA: sugar kinase [Burkholderiales bacterium]|nr:sugar kinase [Burkholderiales bacterium]
MKFDIVCLGEPLYEFSQIPGRPREYLQGFGGDTMNCAIAAARQGARVSYVTRLGDDEFGRQLRQMWSEEGIDTSGVEIDPESHTAVYFISHGPAGHAFSYLRKGSAASRMRPDFLPQALLRSTAFFQTSGISQAISDSACDTVFAAIDLAKAAGARFVYDANIRPRLWSKARAAAVVGATVALADFFFLSIEDAQLLCGLTETDAVLDWCHRRGARCVVFKLGPAGAVASDGRVRWTIPGYRVQAVDATGAGDCFAGAAMARLAAGDSIEAALRYASAAAALTCTGFGAVGSLPRPGAVRALMNG